jgi:hypothetical protein
LIWIRQLSLKTPGKYSIMIAPAGLYGNFQ